jgi:hypothetical protein
MCRVNAILPKFVLLTIVNDLTNASTVNGVLVLANVDISRFYCPREKNDRIILTQTLSIGFFKKLRFPKVDVDTTGVSATVS